MFERYTEKARRTIFFARYEASQFGCSYIQTEHLMLGLFREDKALGNRFLRLKEAVEAMRKEIEGRTPSRGKVSTSVDLPLSRESKRVLAYAAEEAQRLNHKHIGTEHLLLGLLGEENFFSAQLLRGQHLTLDSVRQQVQQSDPSSTHAGSAFFSRLDQWLADSESRSSIRTVKQERVGSRTTDFAIYAGDQKQADSRVPLLCIDIIRDERFSEIEIRCDDYIAEGVPQVWLLDNVFKRAYTVTKTEGLREFTGEVLQIANPPLELARTIFD